MSDIFRYFNFNLFLVLNKNNVSEEILQPRNSQLVCGAKMCFYNNIPANQRASEESIQMLTWIYISVMLVGMMIFSILADQVPR